MKILVIEDDSKTADFMARGLREYGHVVDHVADGRDGLVAATTRSYDALVIDRMLPNVDGLTIVKTLRASANKTPILILTTMDSIGNRVEGLGAGADDYLTKPFAFAELLARLVALSRRPPMNDIKTSLQVADLEMDLLTREVKRADKAIELQPQEFRLLEYLMKNAGRVVTRTMLLENVWEFHFDPQTTVVETHMSRLRAKVDKGFGRELIHTLRNVGYVMREHK
jgi:two-component system, OmpR family, response regulator